MKKAIAVRHKAGITKGRKAAKCDKNFSDTKNKEFKEFCRATGLRKKELKCLRGTIEAYAILMDFQIGTRVGEVVVLTMEEMLDNEVYFLL